MTVTYCRYPDLLWSPPIYSCFFCLFHSILLSFSFCILLFFLVFLLSFIVYLFYLFSFLSFIYYKFIFYLSLPASLISALFFLSFYYLSFFLIQCFTLTASAGLCKTTTSRPCTLRSNTMPICIFKALRQQQQQQQLQQCVIWRYSHISL